MKKLLFVLSLFSVMNAFASPKPNETLCLQPGEDGVFAAVFTRTEDKLVVSLSVPEGETNTTTYSGTCEPKFGSVEPDYICDLMTSTESGYDVRYFSTGGPYRATVQSWNMAGRGELINLVCNKR